MVAVSSKVAFLVLRVLVAIEGAFVLVQSGFEFLAAVGGDATPLLLSALFVLTGAAFLYLAYSIRSRASTPYWATQVLAGFAFLLVASSGSWTITRVLVAVFAFATSLLLFLFRGRFQLRPGEFVKEEKLPPEMIAKISTRVQGVRCRDCGDDDVWLTTDKALVCKNCGTLEA